jgi:hypothetical protein
MNKQKKLLQAIREKEKALAFATPRQARKLTSEIVRLKTTTRN